MKRRKNSRGWGTKPDRKFCPMILMGVDVLTSIALGEIDVISGPPALTGVN